MNVAKTAPVFDHAFHSPAQHIDEAWRHGAVLRIDDLIRRRRAKVAYRCDPVSGNCDILENTRRTGAVIDRPASNDDVIMRRRLGRLVRLAATRRRQQYRPCGH